MKTICPQTNWIYTKVKKITKIGRIEIPDVKQEMENIMLVSAIGPDVKTIKVGDEIVVAVHNIVRYSSMDKKDDMESFCKEDDVIAVIKYGVEN